MEFTKAYWLLKPEGFEKRIPWCWTALAAESCGGN